MNYKLLFDGDKIPSFKKISDARWIFCDKKTKKIYYSIDKNFNCYIVRDYLSNNFVVSNELTFKNAAKTIIKDYYKTFYGAFDVCFSQNELLNVLNEII